MSDQQAREQCSGVRDREIRARRWVSIGQRPMPTHGAPWVERMDT